MLYLSVLQSVQNCPPTLSLEMYPQVPLYSAPLHSMGAAEDTDFADLEAMLEKNVAAIDDELVKPTDLQENTMQEEVDMTDTINDVTEIEGNDMDTSAELEQETIDPTAEQIVIKVIRAFKFSCYNRLIIKTS